MKMNIYSVEDQMKKFGLTKEQAEEKIKDIKSVNVFSVEWQMKRFGLTKEQAEDKIRKIKEKSKKTMSKMSESDFNSMIPSKKEHWMKKGYSEEEASLKLEEISKIGIENLNKFNEDRKENPNNFLDKTNTRIEYYISKGFSEKESLELLKNRQSTFSLEKCIEKYGVEEGLNRWKSRQYKWLRSIEGKITNEMRDSVSLSYFRKKYGDENLAISEYLRSFEKRLETKFGKASKSSMKVFKHLINFCKDKNLNFFCGIDGSREFYLMDDTTKKVYAYDFTIPELNMIFEYHGKFWHTKSISNSKNELGVSMSESFRKDSIKENLAQINGFELVKIYEEDGLEYNIKKIFNRLKTI